LKNQEEEQKNENNSTKNEDESEQNDSLSNLKVDKRHEVKEEK
jgi:hypothetical protein